MAANRGMVLWNLWHFGTILFFGESIRYKLLKFCENNNVTFTLITLTLVLAYSKLNGLRHTLSGEMALSDFVFSPALQGLAISTMSSYFALKGSFVSVILSSGIYTMTPLLSPILPQIEPLPWSLLLCFQAFITMLLIYFFVDTKNRNQRLRIKRIAKYERKPFARYAFTVVLLGFSAMFFIGLMPVYPVVILTDSMTGTLDRGSLVFVIRVPPGEAYTRVGEMEIIHFNHGGLDFIHRVIEFRYDRYGVREYITKGDANDIADPFPVAQGDVYGIARAYFPFVGYPLVWICAMFGFR